MGQENDGEGCVTNLDKVRAYFDLPSELPPSPVEIRGACRADLPGLFAHLGYNDGVEVGVYRGRYSKMLCKGNPDLRLTCVDAWKAYSGYRDFTIQSELDAVYLEAQMKLAPYGCKFVRAFSADAAKTFQDQSVSFVYIDGNHSYEGCSTDLFAWVPKIRRGGIISGHDYRHFRRSLNIRVVEAVQGYTAAHDIVPWFLLGRNKVKKGEVRDRERSFFWVVPE
jgi:hypothetical protein